MSKYIESHENNISPQDLSVIKAIGALTNNRMLDPKALPFFEDWKTQNNHLKNALKPACLLDFAGVCDIIEHNEFVPKEVPSYYLHEEYVELCNKYHIPYKEVYHNYRELDATEELVAEYVDLLKSAKNLCIYWDTSTFDIEGLTDAIEEARSEEAECDYFADARSDRWAYYSNTGV